MSPQQFKVSLYSIKDRDYILRINDQRLDPWPQEQIEAHLNESFIERHSNVVQSERANEGLGSAANGKASNAKTTKMLQKYTFILGDNKRCYAFCCVQQVFDEGDILLIVVDKDYRNQGLATQLLTQVITGLAALNMRKCFLDVRVGNSAALALYRKLGFETIATRKNYFAARRSDAKLVPAEDALTMLYTVAKR